MKMLENNKNSTYCADCACRITRGRCAHGIMPPRIRPIKYYDIRLEYKVYQYDYDNGMGSDETIETDCLCSGGDLRSALHNATHDDSGRELDVRIIGIYRGDKLTASRLFLTGKQS